MKCGICKESTFLSSKDIHGRLKIFIVDSRIFYSWKIDWIVEWESQYKTLDISCDFCIL